MPHPRLPLQNSASVLFAALASLALVLALPEAADARAPLQTDAARVAKKVERARARHQAREDVEALAHFQKAIAEYADLHDRLVVKLNAERPVTGGDFAVALMTARSKARHGDVLIPEVQTLFKRLIAEQLKGPDALAARKAIDEGNPEEEGTLKVDVRVNGPYPVGAPHSTVPASLLLVLPALPPALHYRFVGRDLILVDSVAQLIVDFLKAAAPGSTTPEKKLP